MFDITATAVLLQNNEEQVVATQTVWEFLSAGGYIMIPLALCSVAVLTLTMERWISLRRERVVPRDLDAAIDLLKKGDHEKAVQLAEGLNAPAGRILLAGLRRRGRKIEDVERAMEDQGGKEVEKMRGNIRPLMLIASIAPLLGLLGTVIGIQDAFAIIVKAGMGKPENLAGGIEEALVTTIAGLSVAIPALLLASHFNTKVRRLMIEADEKLTRPSITWCRMRLDPGDEHEEGLNLTPLIDVVFLLLIFFLTATTFQKDEVEMQLDLPESQSGKVGGESKVIVINVAKDGRLLVDGREVTVEALQQKLKAAASRDKNKEVQIRGDKRAQFGLVAQVFDACLIAKLTSISIVADPLSTGGGK